MSYNLYNVDLVCIYELIELKVKVELRRILFSETEVNVDLPVFHF